MGRREIHVEERIIDAPLEQVWSLASSFGALKAWMPSIKWGTIEGDGVGAVRTLMTIAGVAKERLEILDQKNHVISYRILDPIALPAREATARGNWKALVKKTKVTWTADAEEVDDEGVAFIKPLYQGFMSDSLAALAKSLS